MRPGYSVGSPTRVCAATGRELATGEAYVAALVQPPDSEEYRRVDVSLDSWAAGARPRTEDGRRLPVLGSWRAVVPDPGARKKLLVDDESLLDMFVESDGDGEVPGTEEGAEGGEGRDVFRFMLALILMRKRLLVCERTDAKGTMLVRPRGSPKSSEGGALIEVRDPGLSEACVARVVGQLAALLDGGAAEPVAPTPSGGGA